MTKSIIKEACVETLAEAKYASNRGADQIELCSRLDLDGLTPSLDLIRTVQDAIDIPVKVMIRPRSGSFVYNQPEVAQMRASIQKISTLGIHGFVFGATDNDQTLDLAVIQALIAVSGDHDITIHKAVDSCTDLVKVVSQLNTLNHPLTILTSGGHATALEGIDTLNKMILHCDKQINIMAAGKVTAANIGDLSQRINTPFFHGRKIV